MTITNAAGDALYVSAAQNENATTRAAVEMEVQPTDIVKIITNARVEETLPFTVYLR